jgi:Dolichyl-phosphate-mannose-protein mannosyltransferase
MSAARGGWTSIERSELLVLGAILSLGAVLLGRHLGSASLEFDEGVYLNSARLLEQGLVLGRDVFSSQPPLFLTAVAAIGQLVGGSLAALHGAAVAVALIGALGGWAIVRGISGPFPALVAAALLILAPGVVDAAAVISADVPSVALGTLALLAARASASRPIWGAIAGAMICCALLVKLLAAPFAIGLLVFALVDRPPRRAIAWFGAGVGAVLAAVAVGYWSVIGELWSDAVGFHLTARQSTIALPRPSIAAEVAMIVTAYAGMLAILAVGLRGLPRTRIGDWARARVDIVVTIGAAVALIAINRPLLHHHLVILAWPLALLAASTLPARPPPRALAVMALAALLLVPWAVRGRDTVEGAESARIEAVAVIVERSTSPGEAVVSDLPLVPLAAGREAAAETVDPSAVRIGTGSLDRREILAAADQAGAVVVGRAFALVPGLTDELKQRHGAPRIVGGIRIYVVEPGPA